VIRAFFAAAFALALVFAPVIVLSSLNGCSGAQHPHTATETARAALAGAAHAVDGSDAVIATRYEQLAAAPGADLDALHTQLVVPAAAARNGARHVLLGAQSTLDAVEAGTAGACSARAAITDSREAVEHYLAALAAFGIPPPPEIAASVGPLASAAAMFAPACPEVHDADAGR
jgi:hypothetical protein